MFIARAGKDWLLLIAQRRRITLPCFAVGAIVYLGVAALWPKVYTGTALVELNPSANWQSDVASQRAVEAEAIRRATTMAAWAAIVKRFDLSPETVADGRLSDAAEALASQVSVEQIDDPKRGGPLVRVRYAAPSRDRALDVAQAVADNLAKPLPPSPREPISFPETPIAPTVGRPEHTGSTKPAKAVRRASVPSADLARELQAKSDEGAKLESLIQENSAQLTALQMQLAQMDRKAAALPSAPRTAAPEPKPAVVAPKIDARLQSLRQELARNQQALDELGKRYTDDYPDVAAAEERVQALQAEIRRLEAIDAGSAQVNSAQGEPPPQPSSPPSASPDEAGRNQIAQGLAQAQSAQKDLRHALERDQAQAAALRAEMASSQRVEASLAQSSAVWNAPDPTEAAASHETPSAGVANRGAGDAGDADRGMAEPTAVDLPAAGQAAGLSIAEGPMASASPAFFAAPLSWLFSVVLGALTAFAAAWLAERRDPSIRGERMLRPLIPESASFLGGIPRVRHEAIPE